MKSRIGCNKLFDIPSTNFDECSKINLHLSESYSFALRHRSL